MQIGFDKINEAVINPGVAGAPTDELNICEWLEFECKKLEFKPFFALTLNINGANIPSERRWML